MQTITLKARAYKDGIVRLEIPTNVAEIEVEVLVVMQPVAEEELDEMTTAQYDERIINPAREAIRGNLAAAGLLSTVSYPLRGVRIPSDEEVMAAGILPPGARPSEELISEDRDEV